MDTRFWGPYGWKFLHTLPYSYDPKSNIQKNSMKGFFNLLGDMLPCIYCRLSYKKYYNEEPIDNHLDSQLELSKWLYRIHNKVNNKLKSQGLLDIPNPTYRCIQSKYKFIHNEYMNKKSIPGLDFIYIIAFHYRNTSIKNKKRKYIAFFKHLSHIIHLPHIRSCLIKNMNTIPFGKTSVYCWWNRIYKKCDIICNICMNTCKNKCIMNMSGCKKKNHKGKTCRRIRNHKTNSKTLKRKNK